MALLLCPRSGSPAYHHPTWSKSYSPAPYAHPKMRPAKGRNKQRNRSRLMTLPGSFRIRRGKPFSLSIAALNDGLPPFTDEPDVSRNNRPDSGGEQPSLISPSAKKTGSRWGAKLTPSVRQFERDHALSRAADVRRRELNSFSGSWGRGLASSNRCPST
jgi:hypothetical protein